MRNVLKSPDSSELSCSTTSGGRGRVRCTSCFVKQLLHCVALMLPMKRRVKAHDMVHSTANCLSDTYTTHEKVDPFSFAQECGSIWHALL